MSSSVSLYTLGNMAQAVCDSVTNAAAGFPKENLLDFNPDTYWKQSSSVAQQFDFDLQIAKEVDAVCLLNQEYLSNFATVDITTLSDDNAGFTSPTTHDTDNLPGAQTQQITLFEIDAPATDRWWRVELDFNDGATQVPLLSGIFFCSKYTISQGNEWPEPDTESYQNRIVTSAGGRTFVQSINKNKQETFQRTYQLNQSDMTILQNAFNDSKGSLYPLILQEGTTNADARYVRFAESTLNRNQIDYQLYRPTVTFVTQPFISDGESY